jgi:uncharacterized protein YjbI with pentapeptide repeats
VPYAVSPLSGTARLSAKFLLLEKQPQPINQRTQDMRAERNGHLRDLLHKIENQESLAGVDLRNLYLSGMDFSKLDLRGANLKGCRLNYGKFNGANLSNADLTDTVLINVSFEKASLSGAVLNGAIVAGADFSEAQGLSVEQKRYLKAKGARGV